jgi:hypothetical protein
MINNPHVFSNQAVDIVELPSLSKLQLQAISCRYTKANKAVNLFSILLLACIGLLIQYQSFFLFAQETLDLYLMVSFAIVILGFIATAYQAKADSLKFYALREKDISYCSGVIFKKTICQPILRVQHVELKRGPIDRKIGLAKLQVFSAGGAMYTFEIPGLELVEAQAIREFILNYKGSQHDD